MTVWACASAGAARISLAPTGTPRGMVFFVSARRAGFEGGVLTPRGTAPQYRRYMVCGISTPMRSVAVSNTASTARTKSIRARTVSGSPPNTRC